MDRQESILRFLDNKTILVTGATGFLAKIFVEKILRVQPNAKKLYLLLRASDSKSAKQRMNDQVLGKELFRNLREILGESFEAFMLEKLVAVAGDITYEHLGVKDSDLRDEILEHVDVILNFAATTDFYDRYDVSLGINTLGAMNVVRFAKQCPKLKMLVHVSTAYVCGEGQGLIKEQVLKMGESLRKTNNKLDVEIEKRVVAEKLKELKEREASEQEITSTMKDFGIERAKLFGWPNTYVFTKAMGEMCIEQSKNDMPLIIIRPSMVTGTHKEPFPGWIEGVKTIDSVIVGYGKGKVTCFLGNSTQILDLIPADMVVNAIIVAMALHNNEVLPLIVYHVASSLRNPISISMLSNLLLKYFIANPLTTKDGKSIEVRSLTLFPTITAFRLYMALRYMLPLQVMNLGNVLFGKYFEEFYTSSKRKLNLVMRLVELYKPYVIFNGVFDDINLEKLQLKARDRCTEVEEFNFNPESIDWEDYILNTHIAGLNKYVIK